MSEQLQLRRGTASQVAAFTGAAGETVIDTTNNRLVVNDGATAGGFPAARLSEVHHEHTHGNQRHRLYGVNQRSDDRLHGVDRGAHRDLAGGERLSDRNAAARGRRDGQLLGRQHNRAGGRRL